MYVCEPTHHFFVQYVMRPADSSTVLPFADPSLVSHVWAAVIVSNLAHLLSVLLLHRLAALMLPGLARSHTAFLTAIVHLFSPAGLFLAAPYGEAPFSLLNFSGMLCYAHACADGAPLMLTRSDGRRKPAHDFLYLLVSGFCFGLATMVRSNGIFSGLIFLYDVLRSLRGLLGSRSEQISSLIRIASSVMAGIVTGSGFVIPQWLAYQQYCVREINRPWCSRIPPSIYSWVQQHYWNVGFLRYWTPSNIPLFLLAAPMLWIMTSSALRVIRQFSGVSSATSEDLRKNSAEKSSMQVETPHLLVAFGLPQLALAALAVTNFHVQIVNRISSGYPVWYLAIASALGNTNGLQTTAIASKDASKSIFRLIIMYAVVQGALFASFLPPA